jgi:hypothetical protein
VTCTYLHVVQWQSVDRQSIDRQSVDRQSVDRRSVNRRSVDRQSVEWGNPSTDPSTDPSNFFHDFFVKLDIYYLVPNGAIRRRILIYFRPLFEVKIGGASWVSRGRRPRPAAGRANPTGNPYFSTQKEVLVMRVVPTVGDERKEFLPLVRLG